MNKIQMRDVNLYKDSTDNQYYLSITYTVEIEEAIYEYHIPKVLLPISYSDDPIFFRCPVIRYGADETYVDIGFGKLLVVPNKDHMHYTCVKIKDKTKKMTLKEIEKKLGYKIELVSE